MEKKKRLSNIAGACFAVEALLMSFNFVQGNFNVIQVLYLLGYALIAGALFLSIPSLMTIGAGLCAIMAFRPFISGIQINIYSLPTILYVAFWVLLAVAGKKENLSKKLGYAAGVVAIVRFLIIASTGRFSMSLRSLLVYLLVAVGAFVIGLASDCNKAK